MPFYRTQDHTDHGHFPHKPVAPQQPKTKRAAYLHMDKTALIALCDERGIKSGKGTPIARNQKKPFYIQRLVQWDADKALLTSTGAE